MLLRRECGGKKNKHVGEMMNFSLIMKVERTGDFQIFQHLESHLSLSACWIFCKEAFSRWMLPISTSRQAILLFMWMQRLLYGYRCWCVKASIPFKNKTQTHPLNCHISCMFGSLEYFHYKILPKYSVIKIKLLLIVIRLSPEGETPIQKYPVKAL